MLYIFTYVVTCKRVLSWAHILWFRGAFVWVSLHLLEIGIKSAGLHGLRCGITKISLAFFVLLEHSGPVTLQLVWQWREAWLHITKVSQRQTAVHFPPGWCSPHITHSGEEYSSTPLDQVKLWLEKKAFILKFIKNSRAGARITALPSDLFHDCNRSRFGLFIPKCWFLTTFSTSHTHQTLTLHLAPHPAQDVHVHVPQAHPNTPQTKDLPSPLWNVWLINIHLHTNPRWTPRREVGVSGVLCDIAGISFVLFYIYSSVASFPWNTHVKKGCKVAQLPEERVKTENKSPGGSLLTVWAYSHCSSPSSPPHLSSGH